MSIFFRCVLVLFLFVQSIHVQILEDSIMPAGFKSLSKAEILEKYANDTNELEDFIRSYYYHKHRSSLIYIGTATIGVGLFIGAKSFDAYSKDKSTEAIGGFVLSPLLITGGGYLLNQGLIS